MKLSWTERALTDIASIDRWLTEHAAPEVAEDQVERIRIRARRLRDFPRIGQQLGATSRTVAVHKTPYVLIYRISNGEVEILRVQHNRQDWRRPE